MNIFQEIYHSLWDFKRYPQFLGNKKSRVFLYGLLVSILFFVLTIVIPQIRFQVKTGGLMNLLETYVPDFELADGEFWLETPFHYEGGGMYIDADTSIDTPLYDFDDPAVQDVMKHYDKVFMADYEKFYLKNNGQVIPGYWSSVTEDTSFSRDDIKGFIPLANGLIVAAMLFMLICQPAGYFLGALALSIVGLIIAAAVRLQLGFGKIFLLCVYARTLPVILKGLFGLFRIHIPFFWILSFVISGVYLFLAMQKVKEAQAPPVQMGDQTV